MTGAPATSLTTVHAGPTMRLERAADLPIARLVLARPPANEIGLASLVDLEAVVAYAEASDLRALIIQSELASAFSAGADLRELQRDFAAHHGAGGERAEAVAEVRRFLDRIHAVMDALDLLPLTTIAALHGAVFGGGFELALACDLRVADQSTRFSFPELRLGLVPGWGGTVRLAREAPQGLVRDLLLTGRTLGAQRAYDLGLVSQLVPRGEAPMAAWRMAEQCARFTPAAVRAAKRLTKTVDRAALEAEKQAFADLFAIDGEGGGPVLRALTTFVTTSDKRPYLPPSSPSADQALPKEAR
ncbi:MAG: enoyl-CoA hydratase/isomerase family protein [Myxococcota bacterium]